MPPVPNIIWIESTDSTNAELLRNISSLDNLSVISARCQSSGRGQGDHVWHSVPGENLTCSVLLRFQEGEMKASEAVFITRITTLAILDLLKEEGVDAWIKWPNDIWVGDRKICGILIQNSVRSAFVMESVIGIGLNVNECDFPSELPNPVSLRQITGRKYVLEPLLERLTAHIASRQEQYKNAAYRHILTEEFEAVCRKLDETGAIY